MSISSSSYAGSFWKTNFYQVTTDQLFEAIEWLIMSLSGCTIIVLPLYF